MTKLYGVIGDPISHSLSPLIQNGWMRDNNLDAEYFGLHIPDGELKEGLETLERRGAKGLNVTLPHKQGVLELVDEVSDLARRLGAANTLIRTENGGWRADNTDAPGFVHALNRLGADVAGKNVFLLGAGGSARAVAVSLSDLRAKLTICNRTPSRAESVAALLATPCEVLTLEQGLEQISSADVVVNTLSLGHSGAALSLPEGNQRFYFDISYGKAAKPTLEDAASKGWQVADGLGMLVAQAAYSFELWFGIMPDIEKALERCRRAVEAAP